MTGLGRRFLAMGFVLLTLSLALSVKTLYYPAIFMLLLVCGSGLLIWVNGRSLYVMFFTSSRKLTRGDELVVEYMLTNRGICPIFYMDVQIDFKKEMGLHLQQTSDVSDGRGEQLFFAPYQIMTFKRGSVCQRRGFFKVGNMSVVIRDPLGFFKKTIRFEKAVNITVFPKIHKVSGQLSLPLDADGLLQARNKINEDRTSIRSIRAYESSDAIQNIHWKVSARLGQPYVKSYQVSAQDTLVIMVNGAASDYQLEGVDPTLLEEKSVELAISYGKHYMDQGVKVSMLFLGKWRREVGFSGAEAITLVLEEGAAYELDHQMSFENAIEAEIGKWIAGARIALVSPDQQGGYRLLGKKLCEKGFHVQVVDPLAIQFLD